MSGLAAAGGEPRDLHTATITPEVSGTVTVDIAGSVVNRCGGGWSCRGRRAVRPRTRAAGGAPLQPVVAYRRQSRAPDAGGHHTYFLDRCKHHVLGQRWFMIDKTFRAELTAPLLLGGVLAVVPDRPLPVPERRFVALHDAASVRDRRRVATSPQASARGAGA